jgi:hypothetical protein
VGDVGIDEAGCNFEAALAALVVVMGGGTDDSDCGGVEDVECGAGVLSREYTTWIAPIASTRCMKVHVDTIRSNNLELDVRSFVLLLLPPPLLPLWQWRRLLLMCKWLCLLRSSNNL